MNPRLPTKVKTDGGDVKRSSFGEKMSSVWNSLGAPEDNWTHGPRAQQNGLY